MRKPKPEGQLRDRHANGSGSGWSAEGIDREVGAVIDRGRRIVPLFKSNIDRGRRRTGKSRLDKMTELETLVQAQERGAVRTMIIGGRPRRLCSALREPLDAAGCVVAVNEEIGNSIVPVIKLDD